MTELPKCRLCDSEPLIDYDEGLVSHDWSDCILSGLPWIQDEQWRKLMQPGTPAAHWRTNGEPDPHGTSYDCERAALCNGHMTDDELANEVFLNPGIANLTAAKERIRWLSRKLMQPVPDGFAVVPVDDLERIERISRSLDDGGDGADGDAITEIRSFLSSLVKQEPAAGEEYICPWCGGKGWRARCGECIPY